MATTTFVNNTTISDADWFNDVDRVVYDILNDPADAAAILAAVCPNSAALKAAVSDETGSGALVFATSPILVTPALGTPSSGNLANCTGVVADTAVTQAVGDNTTKVATTAFCEAGFVNNDVGDGATGLPCLLMNQSGATVTEGATVAGSGLNGVSQTSTGAFSTGTARAGTWRNVGGRAVANADYGTFQRIS